MKKKSLLAFFAAALTVYVFSSGISWIRSPGSVTLRNVSPVEPKLKAAPGDRPESLYRTPALQRERNDDSPVGPTRERATVQTERASGVSWIDDLYIDAGSQTRTAARRSAQQSSILEGMLRELREEPRRAGQQAEQCPPECPTGFDNEAVLNKRVADQEIWKTNQMLDIIRNRR